VFHGVYFLLLFPAAVVCIFFCLIDELSAVTCFFFFFQDRCELLRKDYGIVLVRGGEFLLSFKKLEVDACARPFPEI